MNETVHIVLDTSGSMTEDSKQHSGIYLLLSLRRFFKDHGIAVSEWQWSHNLTPLEKIQSISWSDSLDWYSFSSFYKECQDTHPNTPIILLSDGDFPSHMDVRNKEHCFLLCLGEGSSTLHYHFPDGRLWLPPSLNGQLTLLLRQYRKQVGG